MKRVIFFATLLLGACGDDSETTTVHRTRGLVEYWVLSPDVSAQIEYTARDGFEGKNTVKGEWRDSADLAIGTVAVVRATCTPPTGDTCRLKVFLRQEGFEQTEVDQTSEAGRALELKRSIEVH